jgi:hypothetical protein
MDYAARCKPWSQIMIDKPLGLDEDATGIWSNVKWKAAPSKPFRGIL